MKCCFISICSKEYLAHYKILYNSLKTFSPSSFQILYHIGNVDESFDQKVDITDWFNKAQYSDTLTKICSLRARVVLDAFDKGYDKVVFLGAKVEFFSSPQEALDLLNNYDAIVTPHITEPLPDDDRMPSNASVSFTGHISTDIVFYRNTEQIKRFLIWQDEIMKTKCKTTNHTYLDQSWINFLPFFCDKVYILKHLGYNVAYWNMFQREMKFVNGKWMMKDEKELVCFQYSGLEKGKEENISKHQNRYKAMGDMLQFLLNYTNKL